MKTKSTAISQNRNAITHKISIGLALAIAFPLFIQASNAATLAIDLGSATDFAVLAGAGITVAGPINSSSITGHIGSFATTTITGLENLVLDGTNHAGSSITQQAKLDLSGAYTDAAGRLASIHFPLAHNLGGSTLVAGVYNDPSSLFINGALTLDAGGDPNAVWIFQAGSTLITGVSSTISLINGAQADNVFWQVGSSATIGADSQFVGSILAQESITLNTGAMIIGRALAITGAVTVDNNTMTIPEAGSSMLFAAGLTLLTLKRKRKSDIRQHGVL